MTAGIGHNQPGPLDRARELIETTNRWRRERPRILDADMAGIAQDFLGQLRANRDDLEAAAKAEREPLNMALALIRLKYNDPLSLIGLAINGMSDLLAPWLQREQTRLDDEAAQRRQQLEEAHAEAERAADQARRSGTVEDQLAHQRAAQHVEKAARAAAKPAERARVRGDLSPRATSLKAIWFAAVIDEEQALKSYWRDHTFRAAALIVATRLATALAKETKGDPDSCPPGFSFRRKDTAV
jgi:hypothetical protein